METGTAFAVGLTAATALGSVAVAVLSLRPESGLRQWYGVDPDDDAAVRSNALVVGASGLGLAAIAASVVLDVPERVVGTASVLGGGVLCVVLGWLIRYRDRRDLLATRNADRETAERLGGAAIACGLLVFPLVPAIWFGVSEAVMMGLLLVTVFGSFLAVAFAHR